jgi:purine-cytosine permease-like protein
VSGSLTYRLSADDLEAAYRGNLRRISARRILVLVLLGVGCGVLISGLDGFRSVNDTLTFIAIMLGWILVVLILIIVGIRWFWLKRFANRIYAQQRDFHGDVRISWNDAGFETETATGTTNLAWADFHAWKRSETMLLLYRSEAMFHFIPLSVSGAAEAADEMVALLTTNGVQAKKP